MSIYTDYYGDTYGVGAGPSPGLTSGQYSLGRRGSDPGAFVYGGRSGTIANNIYISDTQTDTGTVTVQDQAVVGHDGMLFGVDTLPGMIITQTGFAKASTGAAAMDAYSLLAGAWNDPGVRLTNGAVQVLRAYYPYSGAVRRCYGRGRKIMPTYGLVNQGIVAYTAQFQAADNTWYSDVASTLTLTTAPAFGGGLVWPATPPFNWQQPQTANNDTVNNTGSLPTWPVITFLGPSSQPGIAYVNTPVAITYNGTLKPTDRLVIDTRPWQRTAKLNGASVAGALAGNPMINMALQPGMTVVRYTGQDPTGQSSVTVKWRNATLAIGGSS